MLHSNRLGQGLPISTIIIAALGLLVLVILGFVFTRGARDLTKDISTAGENECKEEVSPIGTNCEVIYGNFKGLGTDKICCKKGTVKS